MAWNSNMAAAATTVKRPRRRKRPKRHLSRGRKQRSHAWMVEWFPPPVEYTTTRTGNVLTVTAVTKLTGDLFYHWYIDGNYIDTTRANQKSFVVEALDQIQVEAIIVNHDGFDVIANAPAGYPARVTLHWVRSIDPNIKRYRIEQQKEAEGFAAIGVVTHADSTWYYTFLTPRLETHTNYDWQIVPVDLAGNDGTPLSIPQQKIVRTPDAPNFTIDYASGNQRVTFTEVI